MGLQQRIGWMLAGSALTAVAGVTLIMAVSQVAANQQDEHEHGRHAANEAPMMDPEFAQAWIASTTPGEHHAVLGQLVGEWEGAFTVWMSPDGPPMPSQGTISREMILDGRFLKEIVEADTGGGLFSGLGYVGYSNMTGQYQSVWMDNMNTSMESARGTYNPDTRMMTFWGESKDITTGKTTMVRSTLDLSDPDRHVYAGYTTGPDGHEFQSFKGIAERRRAKGN